MEAFGQISTHTLREEGDCPLLGRGHRPGHISTHTLREEGDCLDVLAILGQRLNFYPHPPRGGRRQGAAGRKCPDADFYPHPPRGGRPLTVGNLQVELTDFYPHPPRGGRRSAPRPGHQRRKISTHTLREEGDPLSAISTASCKISTHTLREEGDLADRTEGRKGRRISTHTLREEGDQTALVARLQMCNFYPHPPRGGRRGRPLSWLTKSHFYPHPPRGGRLSSLPAMGSVDNFYPHPPRGGRLSCTKMSAG